MGNMLHIVEVLNTKYPVSQEEAQTLYPILEKAILSESKLILSFKSVENCASIFINSLLGRLYRNYSVEVDNFIELTDIVSDENVIEERIQRTRIKALESCVY